MDQSSSDISMSPSQILERLQVLRQLQLLQRGKLHKHSIQFQESNENSSNLTEMVSHFTNSPSYSTFRGLLHNSSNNVYDSSPRTNDNYLSQSVNEQDLIEGVSVLNLSQESEFVINSPTSTKSTTSVLTKQSQTLNNSLIRSSDASCTSKKHISLDEMPIIHPKEDFETLIQEKLKHEENQLKNTNSHKVIPDKNKSKSFLRKGEGMARFGLQKNALVIQNTKSLPWVRKKITNISNCSSLNIPTNISKTKEVVTPESNCQATTKIDNKKPPHIQKELAQSDIQTENLLNGKTVIEGNPLNKILQLPKGKHPLIVNKGKTWASVLTKEQNDFLKQLKQSDYYKNFASPTKSNISDVSYNEDLSHLRQEQETAEQNMFELLESKVTHESFNIENSFINRFLRRNKLECSGESTPLMMQKCLTKNPDLMHIFPKLANSGDMQSEIETCDNEYTDCCSDTCSSVSTCCNCNTHEEVEKSNKINTKSGKNDQNNTGQKENSDKQVTTSNDKKEISQIDTEPDENAIMKTSMAEMNAKLVATSELLKDRLRELEDEIETFRKENANLTKLREEIDLERKKFYEEKKLFEQKLNEEKILSEYYLAEEKEKLAKQKQIYERHVREMRGRLNKRDKDEVVSLKKEISDLKDEIRLKDAKSTSTIARLRNQLKIVEKEKKDAQDEIEKLKKENRRIHHSNDVTRRMTNIKYLEQINKKLSNMTSKDTRVKVKCDKDTKYRIFEIERDSRKRKVNSVAKNLRPRAKSVPNLNVTSRYAKYFSQKDSVSEFDKYKELDDLGPNSHHSDDGDIENVPDIKNCSFGSDDIEVMQGMIDHEEDNYLEKVYTERFQHLSPKSDTNRSNNSNRSRGSEINSVHDNTDDFFIRHSRSDSNRNSKSPSQTSLTISQSSTVPNSVRCKSPHTVLSRRSSSSYNNSTSQYSEEPNQHGRPNNLYNKSKSPVSILSNHISNITKSALINKENYDDKLIVTPEPLQSKANVRKTDMNPTEIFKPDGSKELVFPNGNKKIISSDGQYSKFVYYNGDVKENFYNEGRIKYYYAETKTYHTTHADGLEVVEFPDGQVEKRYKDGSSEIRLPNGSIRYFDPKNVHIREEWRFPDGATLTVAANGEQRIVFTNGQVEVHTKDHKRREFPDGTVKLVYNDGTSETRYSSGRVRIKDKHGNLILDSAPS